MKRTFTCTYLSFDGTDSNYINKKNDLDDIEETYVTLRCYVDDFFLAISELSDIKDKTIKYYIKIAENVMIDNYSNLFDTFPELIKYSDSIIRLDLFLSSKITSDNFIKLKLFLETTNSNFKLNLKLGNLDVFTFEQLSILRNINTNTMIEVNQLFEGRHEENNENSNIFTFDTFIKIKEKINKIVANALKQPNDIAKILFVYRYIGKKVNFDYKLASLNYNDRKKYDTTSIYNVLIKNIGVCSGIATTFRVLMNAIGIESQVVMSNEHEWNVVKINDLWYHLDLTWDLNNIKANLPLDYFLKSEKVMLKKKDHNLCVYYSDENDIAQRSILRKKYKYKDNLIGGY